MSLLPPPTGTFATREDLFNHVRQFTFGQGYATTIKRSNGDRQVCLRCDRGGQYRNSLNLNEQTRKRNTSSKLIDCPFEAYGCRKADGQWHLSIRNAVHNHDASENLSGHSTFRRLNTEDKEKTRNMLAAGVRPREALSTLRQNNPTLATISRNVYNERVQLRRENLAGRTPIQALLDELTLTDYQFDYLCDPENHITHLFFARPSAITLTKAYSTVLLMDCTYKTNKFRMPLLHVVGMTSFNTTFSSCFVFLKSETQEDYEWALTRVARLFEEMPKPQVIATDRELALMNALEVTFPESKNILCRWHIDKNVLANCRSHFDTNDEWTLFLGRWTNVMKSHTEEIFEEAWTTLAETYRQKPVLVTYLQDTWISKKQYFVSAWTDRYLHLGSVVTSRAEGAHAMLKKYLQVSTGDLYAVYHKIDMALEHQHREIEAQASSERIATPHVQNIPFFSPLLTKISLFALKKCYDQYLKVMKATPEDPLHPCRGSFTQTMGMPCAHKINDRLQRNQTLQLGDFHRHWWIQVQTDQVQEPVQADQDRIQREWRDINEQFNSWPTIRQTSALQQWSLITQVPENPVVHRTRGRPATRNRPQSSTQRDLCAFELAQPTNIVRKCGVCRQPGHNCRTCPNAGN